MRSQHGDRTHLRALLILPVTACLLIALAWWLQDSDPGPQAVTGQRVLTVLQSPDPPFAGLVDLPDLTAVEPLEPDGPGTKRAFAHLKPYISRTWDTPADEPRPCTLIVVDEHDVPVPGARIEVYGDAVKPVAVPKWRRDDGYTMRRDAPVGPILFATDSTGRCMVQGPKYGPIAVVQKDGIGCSGWVPLHARDIRALPPKEIVVPLKPLARLRGEVRTVHGTPAAGVVVEFHAALERQTAALMPPPLTTDERGKFEVQLDGGTRWVTVRDGTSVSRSRLVGLASGSDKDIVLWVAGD